MLALSVRFNQTLSLHADRLIRLHAGARGAQIGSYAFSVTMNVIYAIQSVVSNFGSESEVFTLLPSLDEQGDGFDPECDGRLAVVPCAEDLRGLRYIYQLYCQEN
jgi:hypothetical protein